MTWDHGSIKATCLGCLGPVTEPGLPCPNPRCPLGTGSDATFLRIPVPARPMAAVYHNDLTTRPRLEEEVWKRTRGLVAYPADWAVPPRPAWAWVKQKSNP